MSTGPLSSFFPFQVVNVISSQFRGLFPCDSARLPRRRSVVVGRVAEISRTESSLQPLNFSLPLPPVSASYFAAYLQRAG